MKLNNNIIRGIIILLFVSISTFLILDETHETYSVSVDPTDQITYTFDANNRYVANFLAQFEGSDDGYSCNNGNGYRVEKNAHHHDDGTVTYTYTTAFGLTDHNIKSSSNPYGVYPCDSMSQSNRQYFTPSYFKVNGRCIPKAAVQEAFVCQVNYAKNHINDKFKQYCGSSNAPKLTKAQMTALIDYFNTGATYTYNAIEAYCNKYKSTQNQTKATNAMFKKIFEKENGNTNYNENCQIIKRRECEAMLYFDKNNTCYGQNIYSGSFTYRYEQYHDSAYNCNNPPSCSNTTFYIKGGSAIGKGQISTYELVRQTGTANPTNITWTKTSGLQKVSIQSTKYTVKGKTSGENKITVKYKINGKQCSAIVKPVTVLDLVQEEENSFNKIYIYICIILVACIGLLVYILKKKSKTNRKH